MDTWTIALRLGRVSALPTVWTNALAGGVLGAAAARDAAPLWTAASILLAALSLSLFYVGGMWLNDAFDADADAFGREDRPIPSGAIERQTVFFGGGLLLAGGVLLTIPLGGTAFFVGLALAATIVAYDWLHRQTPFAPLMMGLARFLSYALAAAAAGRFAGVAVVGAIGLFAYVVGLAYAARQKEIDQLERAWPLAVLAVPLLASGVGALPGWLSLLLWLGLAVWTAWGLRLLLRRGPGDVTRAVVALTAGIALYDAVLIASAEAPALALLALAAFGATLALQRLAPGA
ncbi:MAG TPA: UbiA family prenyltransferase [Thermohalobaculum sp.]|nr:UbiA family prenyltransferase [Thermohalobaculum sp.]